MKTKADIRKAKDEQVIPSKAVRKEKEAAARTGGYDEQQVSQLKAVNLLYNFSINLNIFFLFYRTMLVVYLNLRVQYLIII